MIALFAIMAVIGLASCSQDAGQSSQSSYSANGTVQTQGRPVWTVDPIDPGPDYPPAGRSLFDYLVTERQGNEAVYKIPFPFSALVKKIEQEVGTESESSPVKRVLIPLNRSLQRNSARPDFFKYPRAVLAVDTGPRSQSGSSGMLLKDRLFLGYQEKAGIIEVISYNEAAGRFEFQVVKDYRPRGIPKVVYANRALCMTCHQNHSPIFSKPLWEETNANPGIAALLDTQHRDFYGFRVHQGVDIPQALDDATDRANGFSGSQLLWQDGCERADPPASIRCRADLLRFVLQHLLSGSRRFDDRPSDDTRRFTMEFLKHWQAKWPHGLLVPDPDIFNRNPLKFLPQLAGSPGIGQAQVLPFENGYDRQTIHSLYEPSLLRPSKEIRSASEGPRALTRLITGLSQFLADTDVQHLDESLFQRGSASQTDRRYQAGCRYNRHPAGSTERLTFQCAEVDQHGGSRHGLSLDGVFELTAGKVMGGTIDRLSFGNGDDLIDLAITQG
ncbi:MAG: hypothetical protein ICV76_06190 [Nitrospiraceae bacterium]|nr:hypothetical protein [Nitrospiraceae bacterium]